MEKKPPNQNSNGLVQARIDFQLEILLEGDDVDGVAFREVTQIKNVTRRGAFVATRQRLEPGSLVSISDPQEATNRLCFGQVVWSRGLDAPVPGVGIKLVGDNSKWIDHLVSRSIEISEADETVE